MPLYPKPPACVECPAYEYHQRRGFVRPILPPKAKIALVGQGPGEVEAWQGIPFVGPSGRKLNDWLRRAGIERSQCAVLNVVQCWLPGNRPPKGREVDVCRGAHWGPALSSLHNLQVIVPIGVPAGQALLGRQYRAAHAGVVQRCNI